MNTTSPPTALRIAQQEQITWWIWGGFTVAAVALLLFGPERHPVNESYAIGAERWAAGAPLYSDGGCGFIYPPQAAILHWSFTQLPHALYELMWRVVNLGLFAAGVHRLAQCCRNFSPPNARGRAGTTSISSALSAASGSLPISPHTACGSSAPVSLFLVITLMTLPKTWTLALNGQATTAMAGLMLLAVADMAEGRWWRAAGALLLALAFKPLAIVLLLLAGALYRPLLWRAAIGGMVLAAIPYLTHDAAYVTSQYIAFFRNLGAAAEIGQDMVWPNLFSMLHMFGLEIPLAGQTAAQMIAALATLGVGLVICRRCPAPERAVLLYSLAACYLLLFNIRTENNSYTLVMPPVAALAAQALFVERNRPRSALLLALIVALTGGYEITRNVTPGASIVWPCPVACLVFLAFIIVHVVRSNGSSPGDSANNAGAPAPPTELQRAA